MSNAWLWLNSSSSTTNTTELNVWRPVGNSWIVTQAARSASRVETEIDRLRREAEELCAYARAA